MTDASARTFWMRTPAGMMIEARPDAEDDDLVPVYASKRSYDALTAEVVRLRAENQRLRKIIEKMDEHSPRADHTCAEPGITLSEAVMREWPELAEPQEVSE